MGVFSPCVKGRGQMKNVGDEQNQCNIKATRVPNVSGGLGARRATRRSRPLSRRRRRGAPRGSYRLEALARGAAAAARGGPCDVAWTGSPGARDRERATPPGLRGAGE